MSESIGEPPRKKRRSKWDIPAPETTPTSQNDTPPSMHPSDAAAAAAAKLNAMLAAQGKLKKPTPPLLPPKSSVVPPLSSKSIVAAHAASRAPDAGMFTATIEINDLQDIRGQVTKVPILNEINRTSGAFVSVRGRFLTQWEKSLGERPLHLHIQGPTQERVNAAVHRINEFIRTGKLPLPPPMAGPPFFPGSSGGHYVQDKVFIGLDQAPEAFELTDKLQGPSGAYLSHIATQTGAKVHLRGRGSGYIEPTSGRESFEAMYIYISHSSSDGISAARKLCENLIETVKAEFENWKRSQQPLGFGSAPGYGPPPPHHPGYHGYGGPYQSPYGLPPPASGPGSVPGPGGYGPPPPSMYPGPHHPGYGGPPHGHGGPPPGQGIPPHGHGGPPPGQGIPPHGHGGPPSGYGGPPPGYGSPHPGHSGPPPGHGGPPYGYYSHYPPHGGGYGPPYGSGGGYGPPPPHQQPPPGHMQQLPPPQGGYPDSLPPPPGPAPQTHHQQQQHSLPPVETPPKRRFTEQVEASHVQNNVGTLPLPHFSFSNGKIAGSNIVSDDTITTEPTAEEQETSRKFVETSPANQPTAANESSDTNSLETAALPSPSTLMPPPTRPLQSKKEDTKLMPPPSLPVVSKGLKTPPLANPPAPVVLPPKSASPSLVAYGDDSDSDSEQ